MAYPEYDSSYMGARPSRSRENLEAIFANANAGACMPSEAERYPYPASTMSPAAAWTDYTPSVLPNSFSSLRQPSSYDTLPPTRPYTESSYPSPTASSSYTASPTNLPSVLQPITYHTMTPEELACYPAPPPLDDRSSWQLAHAFGSVGSSSGMSMRELEDREREREREEQEDRAREQIAKSPPVLHYCDWPGCEKGFPRPANLLAHRRSHTGEKPFACVYCGGVFSVNSNLRRHLRKAHGLVLESTETPWP